MPHRPGPGGDPGPGGRLAEISFLLAEEGISIFALSTYNTDYILTKSEQFPAALQALGEAGYQIREGV